MNKSVNLSQALNMLEDGNFHSIAYVSADKKTGDGGKIVRLEGRIVGKENLHKETPTIANYDFSKAKKSQNHKENATRNIRLKNGSFRKMHIQLFFMIDKTFIL